MSTKLKQNQSSNAGFIMLDAIVGMGVAAILSVAFLLSIQQASIVSAQSRAQHIAGLELLKTYEVAVAMAAADFSVIQSAVCTEIQPCHVRFDGINWVIDESGPTILSDGFVSSFYLEPVERSGGPAGPIVDTGDFTDDNTLALVIEVTWERKEENFSEIAKTYLHNFD